MNTRLLPAILVAAILATLFTQIEGASPALQVLPLVLIFGGAVYSLVSGGTIGFPLTLLDYVLLSISFLSLIVSVASADSVGFGYSVALIFAVVVLSLFARSIETEDLIGSMYLVAVLCPILAVVSNFQQFSTALSIEVTDSGLSRFSPNGMHPNLTGMFFGSCLVINVFGLFVASSWFRKLICALSAILSMMVVLAASARSGLLAAAIAPSIVWFIRRAGFGAVFTMVSCAALVMLVGDYVANTGFGLYVANILELNSESRGLDSGGSGRLELWEAGVQYIYYMSWQSLVGLGFRGAGVESIGFYTENSYITIILEHGLVLGVILLFSILYGVIVACRAFSMDGMKSREYGLLPLIAMYMIIQAVFNRYLISIGNGMSILFLLICIKIYLEKLKYNHG